MTTLEILTDARALYASAPSHVSEYDYPKRGTYCPITAMYDAAVNDRSHSCRETCQEAAGLKILKEAANTECLTRFNAVASTKEVLAAFDKAIQNHYLSELASLSWATGGIPTSF